MLLLRGSVKVLEAYLELQRLQADPATGAPAIRAQINRLLLAMRRDCGMETFGLENKDWSGCLRGSALPPQMTEASKPLPMNLALDPALRVANRF